MLPVEPFHQTLDGCFLIGAVGDFVVYRQFGNVGTTPFLNQLFQVVVAMEGDDLAVGIAHAVYHLCCVSVGVINYRSYTILFLQAVCILYCLFASGFGTVYGTFGFYHRQRFAALAKEHVVGVADARRVELLVHSLYLYLDGSLPALDVALYVEDFPASLVEHIVDEALAGNGFAFKRFRRLRFWRFRVIDSLVRNMVCEVWGYGWLGIV